MNRKLRNLCAFLAVLLLGQIAGCSLGYYWQATSGHLELMSQRRDVAAVMADPATSDPLRNKLQLASGAVDFAHEELGLPDNGSYRVYADTGRTFVVWNVIAAPEFSLDPKTWCFVVAGCVSYRGYFAEQRARSYAADLASRGYDVHVAGVHAYSTLGRFRDPLLNTMLQMADDQIAGLIFHELAHQQLYVRDDSSFNEGFASFVEHEGIRRWLTKRGDADSLCAYQRRLRRRAEVRRLLTATRKALEELYARPLDQAAKRSAKARLFADLTESYQRLRRGWHGPPAFDGWFMPGNNNARMAALATYDDYLPAFEALLTAENGDLGGFHRRAAELARLPRADRERQLQALLAAAVSDRPPGGMCPERPAT
jgi:predicted aminopeptidase